MTGLVEVEVVKDEHSREAWTSRLAEYAETAFRRGLMDTPVMKLTPANLEAAHNDGLIGAGPEGPDGGRPGFVIRTVRAGDLVAT